MGEWLSKKKSIPSTGHDGDPGGLPWFFADRLGDGMGKFFILVSGSRLPRVALIPAVTGLT